MLETITTKIQYNAIVILSYFFICLVILILNKLVQGKLVNNLFSTGRNDSILNPLTYFKLISHSLGHSSWDHLYNNFLKILLIGPLIEEKYGSLNLLIMMILTSLVIGIINRIFSKNRILGASGIAYMLIVLCSFVNIESGKIPITVVLIILFFVVDEIINLLKRKKDGISHLGHVAGAVCGILLGIFSMDGINIIK